MDKNKLQEYIKKLRMKAAESDKEKDAAKLNKKNIIKSIRISTPPAKTVYKVGDIFNATGMRVEGTFSDGTKKELTEYSYSPLNALSVNDKQISVSVGDLTVTQPIKVIDLASTKAINPPTKIAQAITVEPKERNITGIEIVNSPLKVDYEENMYINLNELEVEAVYSDGSREQIRDYSHSILITYEGFTAVQPITVDKEPSPLNKAITVKSIDNATNEVICENGGWLNLEQSLLVEINYPEFLASEGTQEDSSIRYLFTIDGMGRTMGYAYNLYDYQTMELIGQFYPNRLSYQFFIDPIYKKYGKVKVLLSAIEGTGDPVTFAAGTADITVFDSQDEQPTAGIIVVNQPYKLSYYESEVFNTEGLKIGLRYIDGSVRLIDDYTYYPTGPLLNGNNNYIVVEYKDYRLEIPIKISSLDPYEGYYGNKYRAPADIGDNPKWNISSCDLTYNAGGVEIGTGSYALAVNLIYKMQFKATNNVVKGLSRGWKLNVHQFLVMDGKDSNDNPTYKYLDAENNIHTFVYDSGSRYYDKEGLGFWLDAKKLIIYDDNKNEMHFKDGRLVKTVSALDNSEKHFIYNSGYLTEVYDSRKQGNTYVQLVYDNGRLSEMNAYVNQNLIKTLKYVYENNFLKTIIESVDGQERDLLSFTYDDFHVIEMIENCISHEAVKLTNSYEEWSDVGTRKISYGYIANGEFHGQKHSSHIIKSSRSSDDLSEVAIVDENNISIVYQLNSRCQIIAQLEKGNYDAYYRTLTKDTGKALAYYWGGNTTNSINGYPICNTYDLNLEDIENTDHNGISFWIRYSYEFDQNRGVFAVLKINGEVESVKVIDNSAQNCWIPVCLDFNKPNQTLANVKIELRTRNNLLRYEICNVRLVKCNSQYLSFYGIEKYHPLIAFSNNELSSDEILSNGYYMSENDVFRTLKDINSHDGAYELSLCDGRVRKLVSENAHTYLGDKQVDLLLVWNGNDSLNTSASSWYIQTVSPDGSTVKKIYYQFFSSYYNVYEKTKVLRNNLLSEITTKTEYDYFGRKHLQINPRGGCTRYTYSDSGNLAQVIVGDGYDNGIIVKDYTEDDEGNVSTEISGGSGYIYTYTPRNLLESAESFGYNSNGIVEYGGKTVYGYNSFADRINTVSFITQSSGQNSLNYIDENNMILSDGVSNHYLGYNAAHDELTFGYIEGNSLGVCYKQTVSNTETTNYYYRDDNKTPTDEIEYNYGIYGNLLYINENGNPTVAFEYYPNTESRLINQLHKVYDYTAGDTIEYTYDEDNNLKKYTKNGIEITYNADGSKSYKFTAGRSEDNYRYAVIPSLKGDQQTVVNGDNPNVNYIYEYGKSGLMYKKSNHDSSNVIEYSDDGLRVTGYFYNNGHTGINHHETYGYDNFGNIISVNENDGENIKTYQYDGYGRLTYETNSRLGISRSYEYDNNGRMRVFNDNVCFYDNRGRLIQFDGVSYTYDNFGNRLTNDAGERYEWTRGTLLSKYSDGWNDSEYAYDWQGIRCKKQVNGKEIQYYYEGNKLLGEYNSDGVKTWYYYDANGICGMRRDEVEYEFIKNIFGDVVAIFQGSQLVARYEYSAWGVQWVLNPDGTDNTDEDFIGNINPIRYRGYYYDVESGMYYLQTRYYDPQIGQFISPDSPEYLDPENLTGLNLYAYCNYNPVMYFDPQGTNAADNISSVIDWLALILRMGSGVIVGLSKTVSGLGSNAKAFGKMIGSFSNSMSAVFSVVGYGLIAISNIIEGVKSGKSALNIITDTVFDCAAIALCEYIGIAVGSYIPFGGTFIGATIGAGLGYLYMKFASSNIIQDLKDSFYDGINTIANDFWNLGKSINNSLNSAANDFVNWLKSLFSW